VTHIILVRSSVGLSLVLCFPGLLFSSCTGRFSRWFKTPHPALGHFKMFRCMVTLCVRLPCIHNWHIVHALDTSSALDTSDALDYFTCSLLGCVPLKSAWMRSAEVCLHVFFCWERQRSCCHVSTSSTDVVRTLVSWPHTAMVFRELNPRRKCYNAVRQDKGPTKKEQS